MFDTLSTERIFPKNSKIPHFQRCYPNHWSVYEAPRYNNIVLGGFSCRKKGFGDINEHKGTFSCENPHKFENLCKQSKFSNSETFIEDWLKVQRKHKYGELGGEIKAPSSASSISNEFENP